MRTKNPKAHLELLLAVIEKVIYEGGVGNFAIIPFTEAYYLQVAAARGDYDLYCEVVGNNYLVSEDRLSPDQVDQLLALGWYDPESAEGNFYLHHPVYSEAARMALAQLFEQTITEVYRVDEIDTNNIILELGS